MNNAFVNRPIPEAHCGKFTDCASLSRERDSHVLYEGLRVHKSADQ
jgi:hypothetical protein